MRRAVGPTRAGRGRRARSPPAPRLAHGLVQRSQPADPASGCSAGRRRSCSCSPSSRSPRCGPSRGSRAGNRGARCRGSARAARLARGRGACGAIGVALLVVVVLAGYVGSGTALDNFAPTFILITFWVGLVFASALFGDVFRAFSPWRALGRLLPLGGAAALSREAGPLARRDRAARLHLDRARLGLGRGSRAARHRGARLHAAHARRPGRLRRRGLDALRRDVRRLLQPLRPDLAGRDPRPGRRAAPAAGRPARPRAGRGTVALLAVMIGTVTFDGLTQGKLWKDLAIELTDVVTSLGIPITSAPKLAATFGLVACVLLVARLLPRGHRRRALGRRGRRPGAPAAGLRALAGADRDGLRRRPLPDVPALRGPGGPLPRLGPLRPGLGPLRHRLGGDRLLPAQPERRLVRPGRVRGRGPRRRADPRPRPRARALRPTPRSRSARSTGCSP